MKFEEFAEYLEKLEKTSSRLTITDILVKLIKNLRASEVDKGIYMALGQIGPDYDRLDMGMAGKMVLRALTGVSGDDAGVMEKKYKRVGDLGELAQELNLRVRGGGMSMGEVYEKLEKMGRDAGEGSQERKVSALVDLLKECKAKERKFVVRIVMGKLRIGFSAKTILDALSQIESGNKSLRKDLDRVFQIYPDVGEIVKTVKSGGVEGLKKVKAKTGVPVVPALCQRINEYGEIIKKMGEVGVERKYDGSRVQIHFVRNEFERLTDERVNRSQMGMVRTFTRNLEESSAMFPELLKMGEYIKADEIILDSEACGYDKKTGKVLPFQITITRKRKHGIEEASESVPLKFFVFDILSLDGESMLSKPYWERREILNKIIQKNEVLVIDEVVKTDKAEEIEELHDRFLKEGYEGAVIKKWDGKYLPGRQGWNWVKIKEVEGTSGKLLDTLDLVILGYYVGKGKRSGFGIGAFLVGTKKGDFWVSLCKIGTGLTDEEFRETRRRLEDIKIKEKRDDVEVEGSLVPDVWVEPKIIVEIAADEITKSPSHAGGIALRFPRLIRFRDDKGPEQVTTWKEVLRIGGLDHRS